MSAMGATLCGIPLEVDDSAIAENVDNKLIEQQVAEIRDTGLTITRMRLPHDGGPPRYYVEFPPELPMFKARILLEAGHFDVGQEMGEERLTFYVTKRSVESDGWAT